MTYIKYLENKNLSQNTIKIYLFYLEKWEKFLKDAKPSKVKIIKFLKLNEAKSANTIKLIFAIIMSHLKYLKLTKLYYECLDIKLPSVATVSYTHLTLPTTIGWCRSRWSPYH